MDYLGKYADFLRERLDIQAPIKVIFDASNGTAGLVLERIFSGVGDVEVEVINKEVSGDFPAHGPNPKAEGAADELSAKIIEEKADIGAIFDGDGDRILFVDEKGELIDPFDTLFLIKDSFTPPYIVDVRALAHFAFPEEEMLEVKAGRYLVSKAVEEKGAEIGVERTGHFFFKDFFYRDSAILAAIHVLNAVSQIKRDGQSVSEVLNKESGVRRPPELDFEIQDREGAIRKVEDYYSSINGLDINKLDGISVSGGDFAFNIRTSNTEPVVRINIAAKNKKDLEDKITELKGVIGVDN